MGTALFETNLPGLTLKGRGKVRDIYDLGDALLIVASDRISAFDVVMNDPIPDKGKILTQISDVLVRARSATWPRRTSWPPTSRKFPRCLPAVRRDPARPLHVRHQGEGRPLRVRGPRLSERLGLEGVPRARAASAASDCPRGLVESDRLAEPIFTPATKEEVGTHDQNVSVRPDGARPGRANWRSGSAP